MTSQNKKLMHLRTLLWRNFILIYRNKQQFLFAIFLPIVMMVALIAVRSSDDVIKVPKQTHTDSKYVM